MTTTYALADVASIDVTATNLTVDTSGGAIAASITFTGDSLATSSGSTHSDWTLNGDGSGTVTGGASITFSHVTTATGGGSDTLHGPTADTAWTVSGSNSGTVAGTSFAGFSNLAGAAGNSDTFTVGQGGSLSGTIDGGDGGFDSLVVEGARGTVNYKPTGPHSGFLGLDGTTVTYAGLEPAIFSGADVTIDGTSGDDDLTLEPDPSNTNHLRVTGSTIETAVILSVSHALIIDAGDGEDSVTVAGNVVIPGVTLRIEAEQITVSSNVTVDTGGAVPFAGSIDLEAEGSITVNTGAKLLAESDSGTPGEITIKAKHEAARPAVTIIVSAVENEATVSVTGATISGGGVEIAAEAEDTNVYDDLGDYSDKAIENLFGLFDQLPGLLISELTGIAGQIKVRHATATVSLTNTSITSDADVTIGATASANASMHTLSVNGLATKGKFAFSLGYGEAFTTAEATSDRHDDRRRGIGRRHLVRRE